MVFTSNANAVTGQEWQPGRIIDDSIFTNSNAMSVADIQNFLDSQVPSCDNAGIGSHVAYADANDVVNHDGMNPKFTCLKDYYEVPKITPGPGIPASNYGSTAIPQGAESAAQIIWNAAQKYSINPQVLLVTLQKEDMLVQDTWPLESQYLYAMGSNCPDGPSGAQCDPNYAGFSIQVYSGAALFRGYLDNMNQPWWSYAKPYQNNSILWQDPYVQNCGSGNVYIQTMATAALYTYTPYQPNQAALNNLYGTGDSCSAYGNRNFWVMFNDWFGTTLGDLFQAARVSPNATVSILPGQRATITVEFRNTGLWTWHDDSVNWPGIPPVRLITTDAQSSPFSYDWPNNFTPNFTMTVYQADGTTLIPDQHTVAPGQIASFTFTLTAPWTITPGIYANAYQLVMAGTSISLGPLAFASTPVDIPPPFRAAMVSQSDWPTVLPGDSTYLYIRYKNTGQYAWHDSTVDWPGMPPVDLVTANGNNISIFSYAWPTRSIANTTFSAVYAPDNSTLTTDQHTVNPGQIVEFKVPLSVPWNLSLGTYKEYFRPVLMGTGYNLGATTGYEISIPAWNAVRAPHSTSSQDPYDYENTSLTLGKGDGAWRCVRYQNRGAYTWHDSTVDWPGVPSVGLTTANSNNISIFSYNWSDTASTKRIATYVFDNVTEADGTTPAANQHLVEPNQIARFCFVETAPYAAASGTTYTDMFKPALISSDTKLVNDPSQVSSFSISIP